MADCRDSNLPSAGVVYLPYISHVRGVSTGWRGSFALLRRRRSVGRISACVWCSVGAGLFKTVRGVFRGRSLVRKQQLNISLPMKADLEWVASLAACGARL